ncbi:DEKNAAC104585 [Brettanomyces naardenensis]|uniref:Leukotriene A(4) hydrolase n=1 Tax=Brettanomyces naardenensis TaxID=13370 RepID=A0A448YRF7_BRENA|nr:DEKNAAC104585 [Brettanomyces naardenensis]
MSTASERYPNISPHLAKILGPHLPRDPSPEADPSTISNYVNFKINKSTLDLDVSFDKKRLIGSVSFDLETLKAVPNVVLDSSFLNVKKVTVNGNETDFSVKPREEPYGSPLVIDFPSKPRESFALTVYYETTGKCTALQWLEPAETDGHKLPYLFSQCEPTHARSFFPCFDTPSVKSPFIYHITSPFAVLVSGLPVDKQPSKTKPKKFLYRFEQPVPIPSYLVSIASGDIVGKPIGPRSTVYSEPSFIDKCQYEFEDDTEKFIEAAESLVFEYEWRTYNVLILPQSMPFGGMEHPNCTFATPTLISGDRENVDVIAHELAHSWSGNLITNCSFEHFWLNEGWTVYLERRIVGKIHGEKFRHFSSIIGWTDMVNSIEAMGDTAKRFSTLIQDLKDGTDADDSFSTVPYEKGSNLLFTIEKVLGGKDRFDPFIKHYFSKYKYKSVDSYQFLDTLYGFYENQKDLLDSIDWQTWLFEPGLPPKPRFDTQLVDECYSLASKWIDIASNHPDKLISSFSPSDIESFSSNQNLVFLDTLVGSDGENGFSWQSESGVKAIGIMGDVYSKYQKSQNAEVLFRWFRLQLTGRIRPAYQRLADWLGTVGRMKFVRPSYVLLNKVDRDLALRTFKKWESGYHPICRAMVKKDLGLN